MTWSGRGINILQLKWINGLRVIQGKVPLTPPIYILPLLNPTGAAVKCLLGATGYGEAYNLHL